MRRKSYALPGRIAGGSFFKESIRRHYGKIKDPQNHNLISGFSSAIGLFFRTSGLDQLRISSSSKLIDSRSNEPNFYLVDLTFSTKDGLQRYSDKVIPEDKGADEFGLSDEEVCVSRSLNSLRASPYLSEYEFELGDSRSDGGGLYLLIKPKPFELK